MVGWWTARAADTAPFLLDLCRREFPMVARGLPLRASRLHLLVAALVVLAGLAVPINYSYWRHRAARTAVPAPAAVPPIDPAAAARARAEATARAEAETGQQAAELTRRLAKDPHD